MLLKIFLFIAVACACVFEAALGLSRLGIDVRSQAMEALFVVSIIAKFAGALLAAVIAGLMGYSLGQRFRANRTPALPVNWKPRVRKFSPAEITRLEIMSESMAQTPQLDFTRAGTTKPAA